MGKSKKGRQPSAPSTSYQSGHSAAASGHAAGHRQGAKHHGQRGALAQWVKPVGLVLMASTCAIGWWTWVGQTSEEDTVIITVPTMTIEPLIWNERYDAPEWRHGAFSRLLTAAWSDDEEKNQTDGVDGVGHGVWAGDEAFVHLERLVEDVGQLVRPMGSLGRDRAMLRIVDECIAVTQAQDSVYTLSGTVEVPFSDPNGNAAHVAVKNVVCSLDAAAEWIHALVVACQHDAACRTSCDGAVDAHCAAIFVSVGISGSSSDSLAQGKAQQKLVDTLTCNVAQDPHVGTDVIISAHYDSKWFPAQHDNVTSGGDEPLPPLMWATHDEETGTITPPTELLLDTWDQLLHETQHDDIPRHGPEAAIVAQQGRENDDFGPFYAACDSAASVGITLGSLRRFQTAMARSAQQLIQDATRGTSDGASEPNALLLPRVCSMAPETRLKQQPARYIRAVLFDGEEAFKAWTDKDSKYGSRMLAHAWSGAYPDAHGDGRHDTVTYKKGTSRGSRAKAAAFSNVAWTAVPRPKEENHVDEHESVNHIMSKLAPDVSLDTISTLALFDLVGSKEVDAPVPALLADTHDEWKRMRAYHLLDRGMRAERAALLHAPSKGVDEVLPLLFPKPSPLSDTPRGHMVDDDHTPFMRRRVPCMHLVHVPFPTTWHKLTDDLASLDMDAVRMWDTAAAMWTLDKMTRHAVLA